MNETLFLSFVRKDTGANVAVNLDHIVAFSDYEIRTTDGQTIPVTKSFDEIKEFIKRYWNDTR